MSSGGQIVGGLIGGVVGFFNPALGIALGAQIGIMLGGLLDPPKGPTVSGPRLGDLTIQTSTYGAVIPRVHGTVALTGNIFWLENNRIKETVVKKKSGGKGGSKTKTKTYVNYATFALGLCKGPIVGVKRIWIKGELFYDAGASDVGTIMASNSAANGFQVYLGTDTQMPDTRMQATLGAANTPAYRGLAYIVFYDLPLAKYGESLVGAQVKVEVMELGSVQDYPYTQFSVPSSKIWRQPVWDGMVYCSVAYFQEAVIISSDGLNWVEYAIPSGGASTSNSGVATDGFGTLLIYGINAVRRSTDHGRTWTVDPAPYWAGYTTDIAWNGEYFLAITDGGPFATSKTGLGWTVQDYPGINGHYDALIWNGSAFFVRGPGATGIYTSKTGYSGSWTAAYPMTGDNNNYNAGCSKNGYIVYRGVGTVNGIYQNLTAHSADNGVTWTRYPAPTSFNSIVSDGYIFFATDNGNYYTSTDAITWVQRGFPGSFGSWVACSANSVFVCTASANIGALVYSKLVQASVKSLGALVNQECLQSGLLGSDIDTTALTSQVRGYTVASLGSIRAALAQPQAAWPFDVVQRGYKVVFVPRGGASVVTIDQDDLDARSHGTAPGVQVTSSREMDSQLPRRLVIKYMDYDREFDVSEQYAERLNTDSVNEETQELAIVMTSAEAAGKAEVLLYLRWLERYDLSFNLPATFNHLEPADPVTLETPEGNVLLRLTAVNYTSDGRLECKAKYASQTVYTPVALGVASAVTGPATMSSNGLSTYALLDVPYLHAAQADPGFLAAMYGGTGWPGGVLVRTDDGGTTWNDLQGFDSPGGDVGAATNTIGVVDYTTWDKASSLSVVMSNGTLSSVTELAVLNGENYFAYGDHGRWEIIGVQNCTLVSGASYTLYDMLRGRAGTEWTMGLHQIGDRLVSLNTTDVTAIGMAVATIGISREYRGITYGNDIDTDKDLSFTYAGVNLECLSPVHLKASKVIASNDWNMEWVRRSRTDGEWRDKVDAGLGETTEAYEVYIYTNNTFTTIKRTISSVTQSCTYTSAQQVADFTVNQATIYWKVAQLSSVVGPGYLSVATTST